MSEAVKEKQRAAQRRWRSNPINREKENISKRGAK